MFLQSTEAFEAKSFSYNRKLAEFLEPREVIKGEVICREGAPFDYVYFIKSGYFQLTKKVKMPDGKNDGQTTDEIKQGLVTGHDAR